MATGRGRAAVGCLLAEPPAADADRSQALEDIVSNDWEIFGQFMNPSAAFRRLIELLRDALPRHHAGPAARLPARRAFRRDGSRRGNGYPRAGTLSPVFGRSRSARSLPLSYPKFRALRTSAPNRTTGLFVIDPNRVAGAQFSECLRSSYEQSKPNSLSRTENMPASICNTGFESLKRRFAVSGFAQIFFAGAKSLNRRRWCASGRRCGEMASPNFVRHHV